MRNISRTVFLVYLSARIFFFHYLCFCFLHHHRHHHILTTYIQIYIGRYYRRILARLCCTLSWAPWIHILLIIRDLLPSSQIHYIGMFWSGGGVGGGDDDDYSMLDGMATQILTYQITMGGCCYSSVAFEISGTRCDGTYFYTVGRYLIQQTSCWN